jgi:hypothetical protein
MRWRDNERAIDRTGDVSNAVVIAGRLPTRTFPSICTPGGRSILVLTQYLP